MSFLIDSCNPHVNRLVRSTMSSSTPGVGPTAACVVVLLATFFVAANGAPLCHTTVSSCLSDIFLPFGSFQIQLGYYRKAAYESFPPPWLCHPVLWRKREQCWTDCPLHLMVRGIPEYQDARICLVPSRFLPYVSEQHLDADHPLHNAELDLVILAEPNTFARWGCLPTDYQSATKDYRGKLVLIERGGCSFSQKIRTAQEAGVAMAVIINTNKQQDTRISQLLTMIGTSATLTISAHMATNTDIIPIRSALDAGTDLKGRIAISCAVYDSTSMSVAVPEAQYWDNCPLADLAYLNVCEATPREETRLCDHCPLVLHILNSTKLSANHTICLYGNDLLPRSARNVLAAPGDEERNLTIHLMRHVLCDPAVFAGMESKVVMIDGFTCEPFQLVWAAQEAKVAGVIFLPPELSDESGVELDLPVNVEGISQYVTIAVHSVTPTDRAALRGHAEDTVWRARLTPHNVFPDPSTAPPFDPTLEVPADPPEIPRNDPPPLTVTIILVVVNVLLLPVLVYLCTQQTWRTKVPPACVNNGCEQRGRSLPLPVLAMGLALLSVLCALAAFVLAASFGYIAADQSISDGRAAARRSYSVGAQNAAYLGQEISDEVVNRVVGVLDLMVVDGRVLSRAVGMFYYDIDGTWDKFFSEWPKLMELAYLYEEKDLPWSPSVVTVQGFYANGNIITNYLPDAMRGDNYPHVSITNNGSLYSTLLVQFARESGQVYPLMPLLDPMACPLCPSPLKSIGGIQADPVEVARTLRDGETAWYVTQTTPPFGDSQEHRFLHYHPITLLTPLRNRAGVFQGAVMLSLDLLTMTDYLHSVLDSRSSRNLALLLYQQDTRTVLSTSTLDTTTKIIALANNYAWVPMFQVMRLEELPSIAFNALNHLDQRVCNAEGICLFNQKDYYKHKNYAALRVDVVDQMPTDTSGEEIVLVPRGCDVVFDAVKNRDVVTFNGSSHLWVDRYLTLDHPWVRSTQIPTADGRWESTEPLLRLTMKTPDNRTCVAMHTATYSTRCLHRGTWLSRSHSLAVSIFPDHDLDSNSQARIFTDNAEGPGRIILFANGQLLIGLQTVGCKTRSLPRIPSGEWTMIVAVVDYQNAQCLVYINGELHQQVMFDAGAVAAMYYSDYHIGQRFSGKMDRLTFFNVSLGIEDVRNLYKAGDTGALVRHIPEREYYFVKRDVMLGTLNCSTVSLMPRDEIMKAVDEMNTETMRRLEYSERDTRQELFVSLQWAGLCVLAMVILYIICLVYLTGKLSKPVQEVCEAMGEAAVMHVSHIPEGKSLISEINIMYAAMRLMLSNLNSFRPFLPAALFENMTWIPPVEEKLTALPPGSMTGYVAVVFSDVLASTKIWEHSHDGMRLAMKIHNQVLRDAIEEHEGYEVKTIGDAYMVAFDSVLPAARFGLSVQENLMKATWPESIKGCPHCADSQAENFSGLRLRIGIHYGPAELEFNSVTGRYDYFGTTVNKAARVESMGVEGGVTISQEVLTELRMLRCDDMCSASDSSLLEKAGSGWSQRKVLQVGEQTVPLFQLGQIELRGLGRAMLSILIPDKLQGRVPYISDKVQACRNTSDDAGNTGRGSKDDQSENTPSDSASSTSLRSAFESNPLERSLNSNSSRSKMKGVRGRDVERGRFDKRVAATTATVDFTFDSLFVSGNEGYSAAECVGHVNQMLAKLLGCIERTEGSVLSFLSRSVCVAWNAGRINATHLSSSYRFIYIFYDALAASRPFANSTTESSGGALPALRRASVKEDRQVHVGVSTGPLLYGNVGDRMQRFLAAVGPSIPFSASLMAASKALGVFCLRASLMEVLRGEKDGATSHGEYLRPVDTWSLVGRSWEGEASVLVCQVCPSHRLKTIWMGPLAEDENTEEGERDNWGWSASYAAAFAGEDHSLIRRQALLNGDRVLQQVADLLSTGTHLTPVVSL